MAEKNTKPRKIAAVALSGALLAGVSVVSLGATFGASAPQAAVVNSDEYRGTSKSAKPNVVIIYTDDQKAGSEQFMKAVQKHIVSAGVNFPNAHSATSTCCPSRVSLLTGKLAKDTEIWTNWMPFGGFELFYRNGGERSTMATRLDAVGYRTALIGKYLNGYGENERATITGDEKYIPPGWDVWHGFAYPSSTGSEKSATKYYDYHLLTKTERQSSASFEYYGTSDAAYSTDVLAAKAVSTIRSTPAKDPLFLLYTPYGPHGPYETTEKYRRASVPNETYLPPGFGNTTGKPPWVVNGDKVRPQSAQTIRARQIRALYPIDDAVQSIVTALTQTNRLQNTILVFAGDNGYTWGEFNLLGSKNSPYTTAVPTAIRWDAGGLRGGVRDTRLVANIDITRTILTAAGADTSGMPDAINLADRKATREGLVVAAWRNRGPDSSKLMPPFCGYRTSQWLYTRYDQNRFEELYRVSTDPFLLNNLAVGNPTGTIKTALETMRATTKEKCSPTPPEFEWGGEDPPPPPPSGDVPNPPSLTWSPLSASSVQTSWAAVANATSYKCTASSGTASLSGNTCTVTGLAADSISNISVSACNASGCSANATVSTASNPVPPTSVSWSYGGQTVEGGNRTATVSWSGGNASSYTVLGNGNTLATQGTSPYLFTAAAPSVQYNFSVQVRNRVSGAVIGNVNASNNPLPAAPSTPGSLVAQPGKGYESPLNVPITVSWAATSGATSYRVFRGDAFSYWTTSTNTYPDSGLAWNTAYRYKVTACGSYGCSAWSPQAEGRTAPAPAFWSVTRSGTSASVNLAAMPSGSAAMRIKWCDRTASASCNPDTAHTGQTGWLTTAGAKNVAGLTSGRQYAFVVISARGSSGEGPQTISVVKTA